MEAIYEDHHAFHLALLAPVVAAWLSAFAKPGQISATVWEDAPLFASETDPAYGPSVRLRLGHRVLRPGEHPHPRQEPGALHAPLPP
jgi:hypothetical protein